jgi:hypothetical protein
LIVLRNRGAAWVPVIIETGSDNNSGRNDFTSEKYLGFGKNGPSEKSLPYDGATYFIVEVDRGSNWSFIS